MSRDNEKPRNTSDIFFDDSSFFNNLNDSNLTTSRSNLNPNTSNNSSLFNISALCCDEEFKGFDKIAGTTWIYPTNYPVRDYQFNIIQAALTKNTMVSLPTGLGKTFIAAVIMYNFYRWYPVGKIIFTAPTRPLVAQQIEACYKVVGIPPNDTIELTGSSPADERKKHWNEKRVFFCTPQVVNNDLKTGVCPAKSIRCIVFDEAHRASKNYSYCQIMSTLSDLRCRLFRVLALSATPGSKVDDVASVIKNLQIAHLELRTEDCIDVAPYSYSRKINTVVVPLGDELNYLRQQYVEILDTYARKLKQLNILPGNVGNLTRGRVVMLYKEFQTRKVGTRHPQHNTIMMELSLLISLCHGLELLTKHGARVFLNFFDEHTEKKWIQADDRLTALLETLREDLGINPLELNTSVHPDGTVAEIPPDIKFGHPKFEKLRTIIVDHFRNAKRNGQDTKAIVFCEYRESVNLVHCLLLQCRPLILPQTFVGQGAGSGSNTKSVVSQKQQLRIMERFREGTYNTLVATCVAEEGLDVGSVDLIICFDISTRSPIRLVQRCGRTGRERGGIVYILVTEGREHQTLINCMQTRDSLNKEVMRSADIKRCLSTVSPRMIPDNITPKCFKMFITVSKKDKNKINGQTDLRTMLTNQKSKFDSPKKANSSSGIITKEQFLELYPNGYVDKPRLEDSKEFWNLNTDAFKTLPNQTEKIATKSLSTWLEWQRKLQDTVNIKHSPDTRLLVDLLQYADAKRFELPPSTQYPSYGTQLPGTQALVLPVEQKMKKPAPPKRKTKAKSPTRKDGDIRALFSTGVKSTKEYTKVINELGIPNDGSIPTSLIDLMVDLSIEKPRVNIVNCFMCERLKVPAKLPVNNTFKFPFNLEIPDLKSLNIDVPNLKKVISNRVFNRLKYSSLDSKSPYFKRELHKPDKATIENIGKVVPLENSEIKAETIDDDVALLNDYIIEENVFLPEIDLGNGVNDIKKVDINFDLDVEFESDDEKEKTNIVKNNEADKKPDFIKDANINNPFELGNLDEIFNGSDVEIDDEAEIKTAIKSNNSGNALEFFGLNSVEDIFAETLNQSDFEDKVEKQNEIKIIDILTPSPDHQNVNQVNLDEKSLHQNFQPTIEPSSPILSGKSIYESIQCSPILGSQRKISLFSSKKFGIKCSTPNAQSGPKVAKVKPMCLSNKIDTTEDDFQQLNSINWTGFNVETQDNIPEKDLNPDVKKSITQEKSMFTVTQIVDMINKTKNKTFDNGVVSKNCDTTEDLNALRERSPSPILLSQSVRKQNTTSVNSIAKKSPNKTNSLIILGTSSESDDTDEYELPLVKTDALNETDFIFNIKRKSDEVNKTHSNFNVNKKSDEANKRSSNFNVNRKADKVHETNSYFDVIPKSDEVNETSSNFNVKRKSDEVNESPYFVKKPKLDFDVSGNTSQSLKDRINLVLKKTISSNENSQKRESQKENVPHNSIMFDENDFDDFVEPIVPKKCVTIKSKLQCFKRNSPVKFSQNSQHILRLGSNDKRKDSSSSDEEFDVKVKSQQKLSKNKSFDEKSIVNHKIRKKTKPKCAFIDDEAELSGSESGDEWCTQDSFGSIIDFICDENEANETQGSQVDMQAHYLESVKNAPPLGQFKIPVLPSRTNNMDVLSQPVSEDEQDYLMDSFCVGANDGLTQVQDMSALEIAEKMLRKRKRLKKKAERENPKKNINIDSPIVARKKTVRRICSDSSDSD